MLGGEIRRSESGKEGDQSEKEQYGELPKIQNDIIRMNIEDKYKITSNKYLFIKENIYKEYKEYMEEIMKEKEELKKQIVDLQEQFKKIGKLFTRKLAKLKWLMLGCIVPKCRYWKIIDWQTQPRKMEKASRPLKLDTALHSEKQSSSELASEVDPEILESQKKAERWYKKLKKHFKYDSQKRVI